MSDSFDALSRVVDLDRERALATHGLTEHFEVLRGLRGRRALERSAFFREHADEIRDVTFALAYETFAAKPPAPGRFVRVVTWNIERGRNIDYFVRYFRENPLLREADVICLNEVDIGMARSGNRNVVRELARSLGLNYVFGNSYLCLSYGDASDGPATGENHAGLHGNAIMSRYPIVRAENFSVTITKDKFLSSEKRLGHKKALWAEIEGPFGALTVLTVHLDSRASPRQRGLQLADALDRVAQRGVDGRIILGGDFNTTTYDLLSTPRLLGNLAAKFARGGFAHAVEHYLDPGKHYEKPVFEELDRRGYVYEGFNPPGGTTRYEVGERGSEVKVVDYLPGFAVDILRRGLKPWNGVVDIKIDWFAGVGVQPLAGTAQEDSRGRTATAPTAVRSPTVDGVVLSDHDPVVVDIVPAD